MGFGDMKWFVIISISIILLSGIILYFTLDLKVTKDYLTNATGFSKELAFLINDCNCTITGTVDCLCVQDDHYKNLRIRCSSIPVDLYGLSIDCLPTLEDK